MKPPLPLLLCSLLAAICSCSGHSERQDDMQTQEMRERPSQAELWADSVLASMSVEERVGQIFMPATFTSGDEVTLRRLKSYVADAKIGGIVFLRGDTTSMITISKELQQRASIPLFLAIDAEWGLGMRLADAERFPHNRELRNASAAQIADYGERVGKQAASLGLNMVLGPVLDVAVSANSVMNDRSFGSDPERVAELGTAYAHGLDKSGIISVAKHFPGHGATIDDSHMTLPVITSSRTQIERYDLPPFISFCNAGLPAVMAGHIAVPALDSTLTPASVSRPILTGLLRNKLKFNGLIITDAMNMSALDSPNTTGAKGIYTASLLAGADIILVPEDTREAEREILEGIREGYISTAVINDRCRRILIYKATYLLRSKPAEQH